MRFFLSRRLNRIILFPLMILLNASPFAFIEQQGSGKDLSVIHSPQCLAELSGSSQKPPIKYSLYATNLLVVAISKETIPENYFPGTSFDPLSSDLLTYPDRGPPRLTTIL